jgi:hypothetical protein
MNFQTTREEVRALRSERERAADLLARYPKVSDEETREILRFLRHGRHLDVGLLSSDERLRPKLDAFMEKHKKHFRVKWTETATLIGAIVAVLTTAWLAWEAFA